MIYHVKNIVEEIPEMNYNDGIKKVFLYTDGEYGGSVELKKLLSYIKQSNYDNVSDSKLERLHHGVEEIRNNSTIGVKYMQMWEIVEMEKKESREQGKAEGKIEGKIEGKKEGKTEGIAMSIIALLEELGIIPDSLKQTIESQKDRELLNKWLILSSRAATIDEFIQRM